MQFFPIPPTEPGFYWIRKPEKSAELVRVGLKREALHVFQSRKVTPLNSADFVGAVWSAQVGMDGAPIPQTDGQSGVVK